MISALTSSVDPATELRPPVTNFLSLIALAILRESHPEWTTASVATRARELSIPPERVSRGKAALVPHFEELAAGFSRRGRRPFRRDTAIT